MSNYKLKVQVAVRGDSAKEQVDSEQHEWRWKRIFVAFGILLLAVVVGYLVMTAEETLPEIVITSDEEARQSVQAFAVEPEHIESLGYETVDTEIMDDSVKSGLAEPVIMPKISQPLIELQLDAEPTSIAPDEAVIDDKTPMAPPIAESPAIEQQSAEAEPEAKAVVIADMHQSAVVVRQQLTSAIVAREPVDDLAHTFRFSANGQTLPKLIFFTQLQDYQYASVRHVWYYQGQEMASVVLNVGGSHWRTQSSKAIKPIWLGDWHVDVIDGQGGVISRYPFTVTDKQNNH